MLGNTLSLDEALVAKVADKVLQARKLYGQDSAYIIGFFAAFEALAAGEPSAEEFKRSLVERVLQNEGGRPQSPRPVVSTAQPQAESPPAAGEPLVENSWTKGVVKWFNNDKGYGFISTDSSTDVFVHWRDISAWEKSLAQGDEVEFMVTRTAKGFQAINVVKGEGEEQPDAADSETSSPTTGSEVGEEGEAGEEGREGFSGWGRTDSEDTDGQMDNALESPPIGGQDEVLSEDREESEDEGQQPL